MSATITFSSGSVMSSSGLQVIHVEGPVLIFNVIIYFLL